MKRITPVVVICIFCLAVGVLLWDALPLQAQSNCKSFEVIAQAVLPTSMALDPTHDVWGGPLYAMVGGPEGFLGTKALMTGNDGSHPEHGAPSGRMGHYTVGTDCTESGGVWTCANTFVIEIPRAVWPTLFPGNFGMYIGNTAKIMPGSGSGKFKGATGNLNVRGLAIGWPDPNSKFGLSGRWNPEISGNICGIE